MSATLQPLAAPDRIERPILGAGPFIVATDGTPEADGALQAARHLAGRTGGSVSVITVLDPVPVVAPEVQLPLSTALDTQRRADRLAAVRAQIERVTGDAGTWSVELLVGQPAASIARRARELSARVLLVGIGRHGMVDRLFGTETALQLLRMADVPLLAVAPGFESAPKRIVVGTDFSAAATRAARVALDLAAPDATLDLVYVVSRAIDKATWEAWQGVYTSTVEESFDALKRRVANRPDVAMQTTILHGDPATEILAFAGEHGADLVVTGSHGHGFFSRLLIGTVATRVLRGSKCTVLAVPDHALEGVGVDGFTAAERPTVAVARDDWAMVLEAFTRRHTARRVTLEVDDPAIGAQAQWRDYPLLGVAYDRRDDRIEVMLGELGTTGCHLTRNIGGVSEVHILQDGAGDDVALRIRHGSGQTLLTFSR